MDIKYEVAGDRQEVLRFDTFPELARKKLEAKIADLTARLFAAVTGAEPSRTGVLRGATVETIREGENFVTGRVSVRGDFGKAAALEYGAHRPTTVKAHEMRLTHVFGRAMAPEIVMVPSHARTPNIAEHRFLRGPLDAMRGEIVAELEAAVADAVAESEAA